MINNRIRELRKNYNLAQESFAVIFCTTQQTISRIENDACDIPTDLLLKISAYFNVTTDYILGISDVKRDINGQIRLNDEMDQYYNIVLRYQNLTKVNKKTIQIILDRLEQTQREI